MEAAMPVTGRRQIKKLLLGVENRGFLSCWVVEKLNFLARFGPSVPKLDSLVVTSVLVDVNFVEKVV